MGVILVVQLLGYYGAFLITPYDLTWHLSDSTERLVLQIFPLLLFLILCTSLPVEAVRSDTPRCPLELTMLLTIDIGNTNLALGLYEGGTRSAPIGGWREITRGCLTSTGAILDCWIM